MKLVGFLEALDDVEDAFVRRGQHDRGIADDAELLHQRGFLLAVQLQWDEAFVHDPNDFGIAKGAFVQLLAPVAIDRADVDGERQVAVLRFLDGRGVVGAPADLGRGGRFLRRRREGHGGEQTA